MQRGRIEIIKAILTSKYWLLISLTAVFLTFFAFNRGGTDTFIKISGCIVIIELLIGNYSIKKIPAWHLVTAAICIYLLMTSLLNPFGHAQPRQMFRLVRMLIIVFAIHCFSNKKINNHITVFLIAILVFSVCWQFAARNLLNMPYGTYNNPHKLAITAVLALPLIGYFFLVTPGWYKFILIPFGILNGYLLLQTGSFSAYTAIFCAVLFLFIVLTKSWYKWLGLVLLLSIPAILYITDYAITDWAGRTIKMNNLISHFSTDERIQLWPDAWKMLKDNSLIDWIVGNGIGSGREFFPKYATPPYNSFVFPHSYFLEILYDNGVIGFILVFGGLGFLFFSLTRKTRNIVDGKMPILLKCMATLFLIWFIHCGLVFPFYSNYSLYPLGFILGTTLVLMERTRRDGVE